MKAIFWAKLKICGAVLAAAAAVGTGTGVALTVASAGEKTNGKVITVKDFAGREWKVEDWKEGTRPYAKDLAKRESEYREKWGESWDGKPWFTGGARARIMSPGLWKHEDITVIANGKMALPGTAKMPETLGGHDHRCGIPYPLVYAPGTGETVTDIYVRTLFGFYHVDPVTKETVHVGHLPESIMRVDPDKCPNKKIHGDPDYFLFPDAHQRYPQPLKDGLDGEAHAWNTDPMCTLDPIRGRVVFYQGSKWRGKKQEEMVYRYVEKLLPYKLNGNEVLLPAILDYKEMYRKVGAEPVVENGKRAGPRFAIRTTKATGYPVLLAGGSYGLRIALSMDGSSVIVEDKGGLAAVDLETGKSRPVAVKATEIPKDRNKHGGTCGRWDGWFYNSSGQGSGAAPGVLFRASLKTGKVERLYDSLFAGPAAWQAAARDDNLWSGPADAISLGFSSTRYQVQCPRTGAVLNMGWDGAGIPRYHDGFVTCLAANFRGHHRPEWKGQWVASLGNGYLFVEIAPNGDVYCADLCYPGHRALRDFPDWGKGRPELVDGIRIVRLCRTDWPAEQPVAGYWNGFISPEKREELMLEHARKYIADYAEMSKIYQ